MFALARVDVLDDVGQRLVPNCATSIGRKGSRRSRSRDRITLSDSPWSASSAQVSAVISSPGLGVFAVAAAGVLCSFSCVVDTLP